MNSQEQNMTCSPGDTGVHEQGRRARRGKKRLGVGGEETGSREPVFVTNTGLHVSGDKGIRRKLEQ